MKTVALIQARMTSIRLPGKVLADIVGVPMVRHVADRTARSSAVDEVVIATSVAPGDRPLVDYLQSAGLGVFAGNEDDVLSRFVHAAKETEADLVVRISGDCPLVVPEVIDEMVDLHTRSGAEYTGCLARRNLPRGLDAEVVWTEVLENIDGLDLDPYHREHVTPFIYQNPDQFKIAHFEVTGALRRPDLRLCVDTAEDLELVREAYHRFYARDRYVDVPAVIEWLDSDARWYGHNQDSERQQEARNVEQGVRQVKLPGSD